MVSVLQGETVWTSSPAKYHRPKRLHGSIDFEARSSDRNSRTESISVVMNWLCLVRVAENCASREIQAGAASCGGISRISAEPSTDMTRSECSTGEKAMDETAVLVLIGVSTSSPVFASHILTVLSLARVETRVPS